MHRYLRFFIILSAMLGGRSLGAAVQSGMADTMALSVGVDVSIVDSLERRKAVADSVAFAHLPWWRQLLDSGFHIHDPRIDYPKFPRFLLKVYDWGDRTFNSYDSSYVVGTGKNWKIMNKNYNWAESYMLMFSPRSRDMLHIRSDIYNDVGVYLSFMAVSVGYTAKINSLLGSGDKNRRNLNFNFTCSRFSANFDYTSTQGNTHITHFGDYRRGQDFSYKFNDISHKSSTGELYYFFNYSRYSQAAAYHYSKYQLKSSGSAVLGFAFNHQRISMDFSSLPGDMKEALPTLADEYRFRYTDYGVLAGYVHNWVLYPRRWLMNITAIPSVGYRHSYSDSSEGRKNMVSSNLRARFSVVYNHRALFASLTGRFDAHLYFNSRYTFFNSIESLSLIVGARF